MSKKTDVIVDMQYGSTGKGLIAGYLATQRKYDVVVNANMPNAGHTFIDKDGNKMVHKVLPNGVVSPFCEWVLIGPGSVFSIDQLIAELNNLADIGYIDFVRIGIHPNAVVLDPKHKEAEQEFLRIGSTAQGSAVALWEKMQRDPHNNPTAGHMKDKLSIRQKSIWVEVLSHDKYNGIIRRADKILVEGAQGFSLGINQRFYPYCTSRECTPERFLSDAGVPLHTLSEVIGTARTYPIRVGSPKSGYSGDCYPDQQEISWEDIGIDPELTTVTKRERRVFTFSKQQIEEAMWAMSVDKVFLNFANYLNYFDPVSWDVTFHGKLAWIGKGPTVNDVHNWRGV